MFHSLLLRGDRIVNGTVDGMINGSINGSINGIINRIPGHIVDVLLVCKLLKLYFVLPQ